jgi:AcrR family transcriptional regulator
MPRVIKHPEIRRAEILDQAFRIFLERGYDNTSLNEVILKAGLSKGMFYHHFPSKEALLAALFERMTEQNYEAIRPALSDGEVDPRIRLQNVLDRVNEIRLRNVELNRPIFTSLLRPESQMLHQGIVDAWTARLRPILTQIIEEGVENGAFNTFDPEGVADMVLQLTAGTKEVIFRGMSAKTVAEREREADHLAKRLKLHALALSRILGLADDSFTIGPPNWPHRFLQALNPVGRRAIGGSKNKAARGAR